jgi:hypothetical protein
MASPGVAATVISSIEEAKTMNLRPTRRRMLCAIACAAALFAIIPAIASAGLFEYYYGFNYLTSSIPSSCGWSGCAGDSNSQAWDWSGMTKNSGDCIQLGFYDGGSLWTSGALCSGYNGGDLHVTRSGLGASSPNYPICQYYSGNSSYVHCWAQLFP